MERLSLSVPTRAEYLGTIRSFVAAVGQRYGMPQDQIEDLKLALSEVCSAANEEKPDGRISVGVIRNDASLEFDVEGVPEEASGTGAAPLTGPPAYRRRLIDALIPDAVFSPRSDVSVVRFSVGLRAD